MPKSCYALCVKNTQVFTSPPLKMSASPPVIIMSDEEDAHIHEHKITLEREKWAKEERQRQQEEEA